MKNKKLTLSYLPANSTKGFSLLAGINRVIRPSHVTKLANSIDKIGVIRPVLISKISFIDGKMVTYIVEGQHLYMACLRHNIEIPYAEIQIDNVYDLVETLALLNASSKSWNLIDFIQSWKVVNPDYLVLEQLFQQFDIELSQLAEILHTGIITYRGIGGSTLISRVLKKGEFKIKDKANSIFQLNRITDALKTVPRLDRMSNKSFIAAFHQYSLHPLYDHDATLAYLAKNKTKFALTTQDPEEFNKLFSQIK